MTVKNRIIIWAFLIILLFISSILAAFQFGKEKGIQQAYEEIASQNIIFE